MFKHWILPAWFPDRRAGGAAFVFVNPHEHLVPNVIVAEETRVPYPLRFSKGGASFFSAFSPVGSHADLACGDFHVTASVAYRQRLRLSPGS